MQPDEQQGKPAGLGIRKDVLHAKAAAQETNKFNSTKMILNISKIALFWAPKLEGLLLETKINNPYIILTTDKKKRNSRNRKETKTKWTTEPRLTQQACGKTQQASRKIQ